MRFRLTALLALGLGSLGALGTAPALADTRDDVLAISGRCNALGDDRSWLDCYYGSVQPMRARLGLPAAPASQLQLVPQGAGAPVPMSPGDPRDTVLSGSRRCAVIADDRTWLDCYYGAAQPLRARLGLPAAPAAQVRLVPQGVAAPVYAPQAVAPAYGIAAPAYGVTAAPTYAAPTYPTPVYGATAPRVASAAPDAPPPIKKRVNQSFMDTIFGSGRKVVNNIRATAYNIDANKKFTITLTDGEIWQQDVGDSAETSWNRAASRIVVNVYEGALGSYNMEVSDDSHLYKVHRVK